MCCVFISHKKWKSPLVIRNVRWKSKISAEVTYFFCFLQRYIFKIVFDGKTSLDRWRDVSKLEIFRTFDSAEIKLLRIKSISRIILFYRFSFHYFELFIMQHFIWPNLIEISFTFIWMTEFTREDRYLTKQKSPLNYEIFLCLPNIYIDKWFIYLVKLYQNIFYIDLNDWVHVRRKILVRTEKPAVIEKYSLPKY